MHDANQTNQFTIDVSQARLDDLRLRLRHTRFTEPTDVVPWRGGTDPRYLRGLIKYWRDGFDWREQEARLNKYDHWVADMGDHTLHYVHVPAVAPLTSSVIPLLLNHGWPSGFTEMLDLADRLSNPARFGQPADVVFDVIIPSLPGFLFSGLPQGAITREAIGDELHTLMSTVLGHGRYAAFGGDIGGGAAGWMGAKYPEHLIGIQLIHPPRPSEMTAPATSAEAAFLEASETYDRSDGGYSEIMLTRPDTIAAALIDSPVGLLAWIVDKLRDWSDCHGDLSTRFEPDTVLTLASLYWFTDSIATSFRQYYDWYRSRARPMIEVPVGITLSHEPSTVGFPRSLAERACSSLDYWNEPGRGGHFLAAEEPELAAAEIRHFLGPAF
jgi:pimeloyl-ACP methyl ester carboxylesterase